MQNCNPYGNGTTANSPIIALGEAWGHHMGHFLADQRYGLNSSETGEQGIGFNNNDIPGFSSHLVTLENFDPNRTVDPFHWIPKGLMYDLMDNRNELFVAGFPLIDDEVAGYTIQQIFAALQSDVSSPQQYRVRIQQQNRGNQTIQITNLFAQYGY